MVGVEGMDEMDWMEGVDEMDSMEAMDWMEGVDEMDWREGMNEMDWREGVEANFFMEWLDEERTYITIYVKQNKQNFRKPWTLEMYQKCQSKH